MREYQRIDRISEEVRRELDAIIREEINDPRVDGTWSITRAEVTGDLRYAAADPAGEAAGLRCAAVRILANMS